MEYREIDEVIDRPGLRLVLTRGVPGPWGMAARFMFETKGLDYVAAAQQAGSFDEGLRQWSGQTGAPVAAWNDEPPRTGWAGIVWLAERLAPEPALVPADPEERVLMFGLAREIVGEHGFGWCRRLMSLDAAVRAGQDDGAVRNLCWKYGYRDEAVREAPGRCVEVLELLARHLRARHEAGEEYFMGNAPSALDFYWAAFSQMLEPLPAEVNPMPGFMHDAYRAPPEVRERADHALLRHRDMMYERHIGLPLDF